MAIAPISNPSTSLDPTQLNTAPLTNETPAGQSRSLANGNSDLRNLLELLIPLMQELSSLLGKSNTGSQPPAGPSGATASSPTAAGNPAVRGWLDVYNDRLQRMQEAQDPALKAHYQAELDVIRKTLDQMGVSPEQSPNAQGAQQNVNASGTDLGGAPQMSGNNEAGVSVGKLPPALSQYASAYESASRLTGVPANILAAMNWQESRGNSNAPGGGLGQMTPERFADLQAKHPELAGRSLSDPASNILATAFFMKDLMAQFGGSLPLALRAYNSGENGVNPNDPNATPAGTGDPTYVEKVISMSNTIASGGEVPA
jgi:hypothetical protein